MKKKVVKKLSGEEKSERKTSVQAEKLNDFIFCQCGHLLIPDTIMIDEDKKLIYKCTRCGFVKYLDENKCYQISN